MLKLTQSAVVTCAVLLTPAAMAQNDAASATSSLATTYQQEIDALGTMSGSLGPMVVDARARVKLMKQFIEQQDLLSDWANFTPPPVSSFQPLTFNQALQTAFDHQKLMPATPPSNMDVTALANQVRAEQTLIHKQWDQVNELHHQVDDLTAFLTGKNKLKDYKGWAIQQAADVAKQQSAARAEHLAAEKKHAEYQAELRRQWDQAQQKQMMQTIAAERQREATPQGGGGGGASTSAQQSQSDEPQDYYDGSYWNGYADPYYDVWGVPDGRVDNRADARTDARTDARVDNRDDAAQNAGDQWDRNAGSRPAISPSHQHRSGRRR